MRFFRINRCHVADARTEPQALDRQAGRQTEAFRTFPSRTRWVSRAAMCNARLGLSAADRRADGRRGCVYAVQIIDGGGGIQAFWQWHQLILFCPTQTATVFVRVFNVSQCVTLYCRKVWICTKRTLSLVVAKVHNAVTGVGAQVLVVWCSSSASETTGQRKILLGRKKTEKTSRTVKNAFT